MMNNRQRIVRDLQTGEPYSAVIARPTDFAAHPADSTRTPAWEATGNLHLSQCLLSVSRETLAAHLLLQRTLILPEQAPAFGNMLTDFEDEPARAEVEGRMYDEPGQAPIHPGIAQRLTSENDIAQDDDALAPTKS